jgi:hypothetical protein
VTTLSRAPFFVGTLGFAFARAGRTDEAMGLLRELEDRASLGEYVPAIGPFSIYVGLGHRPAIRRLLPVVLEEATPPLSLCSTLPFLKEYRHDPEIDRMLFDLYGR